MIIDIITELILLAFTILIPYVIAKSTKGKALKIEHLIVCMIIIVIFHGMESHMAMFYCLFKLIGVGKEEIKNETNTE